MLFNSPEFIFLFLPLALAGYYGMIRIGFREQIFVYLVFISLIFYAVWKPEYVILLVASMGGNYLISLAIQRAPGKGFLAFGVIANLAVLGWFKYANFVVDNINTITDGNYHLERIILPLAISFYTFQQIAYLVDVSRGEVKPQGIMRYATFVIFFPQLIAGPIVHYKEMVPQFFGRNLGRFMSANLVVGLAIFAIGLAKKTLIADTAAGFSTPIYQAAAAGEAISFLEGWRAGICYTIQLYFDFSGYSDMAIGLARMFGILLPLNFHSPLRAASIIEYWRRWHMTLQAFIVSYMYQPVLVPLARFAANRGYGKWPTFAVSTATPTIVLFMVIGLWHGAGWTFVVFGLMHGIYIAVNEFWRAWRRRARRKNPVKLPSLILYHIITLIAVIFANVVFRATDLPSTFAIWSAMLSVHEIAQLPAIFPNGIAEALSEPLVFLLLAWGIIFLMPNTQTIMGRYRPCLNWAKWRGVSPGTLRWSWRLNLKSAAFTGIVLFLGVAYAFRGATEFIYFNF